jgi:hypothetical protein
MPGTQQADHRQILDKAVEVSEMSGDAHAARISIYAEQGGIRGLCVIVRERSHAVDRTALSTYANFGSKPSGTVEQDVGNGSG